MLKASSAIAVAVIGLMGLAVGAEAQAQTRRTWSIELNDSPEYPQDIALRAVGNNTDGWRTEGAIYLGVLAQGFGRDQYATLELTVLEAGIVRNHGSPVEPGEYIAPEAVEQPQTPAGLPIYWPTREFTVVARETFYLLVEALLASKVNMDELPPVGSMTELVFTFEALRGPVDQQVVNWAPGGVPFGQGSFEPFLNEGVMRTDLRRSRR